MKSTLLLERKIKKFEYDENDGILTIYFESKIVRKFSGIPNTLYDSFANAIDKDKFYKEKIEGAFCLKY